MSTADSNLPSGFSMPVADQNRVAVGSLSIDPSPENASSVTLRSGVLACACPDCSAPMSVRRWLMLAECWRCETSIALSLEQIKAISQGLSIDHDEEGAAPGEVRTPVRSGEDSERPARAMETALERQVQTVPALAPDAAPSPGSAAVDEPILLTNTGLRDLLSWLTSAIVHLLLLILLILLTLPIKEDPERRIVLSVDFSEDRLEGELPNELAAVIVPDFDLPVSKKPTNQRERDKIAKANEDARDIRFDPKTEARTLPPINRVREALSSDDPYRRMVAARDPRVRAEVVRLEGGTTMTEAAVARALRWMARHQHDDGSWRIRSFDRCGQCRGRCDGTSRVRSPTGGAGLALQAFLGAGQTHQTGVYQDVVGHGLQFLLDAQEPDGDLRGKSDANAGMYAHAQAAIVLCDAYQLTGDEVLRLPAQRAIDFLADAQHEDGGWRYGPGQRGDTSVIGWQLMALHSARAGHLKFPDEVLFGARKYLDSAAADDDGAVYAYRPGGNPTPAMTAEGLLSRMYLGWNKKRRGLRLGVALLSQEYPPDADEPNLYYWYYATQLMHHWGGPPWIEWNRAMRDILVSTQETSGHEAGSWYLGSHHDRAGGRLYMTALACCTLEVYYRHAPLFRKIDLR